MTTYSTARKAAAFIGVALILATASGATSVMTSLIALLIQGMQVDLTTFMLGPAIATVCAAIMSAVGTKVINIITPKWSMLIGSICSCITIFLVGMATNVSVWIVANILNGIVLAFATWAAAGGIIAEFFGEKTQSTFGILSAVTGVLTAAWLALTSALVSILDYRTLFSIYAVAILAVGVVCNFVLIGRVPRKSAQTPQAPLVEETLPGDVEAPVSAAQPDQSDAGYTFGALLKQGLSIYLFLLAMVLVAWCTSGVTTYASVFFTSFMMDPSTAAAMLSVFTLAGAVLVFCAGFAIKKIGPVIMTVVIYCGFAIGIVFLLVWTQTQVFAFALLGMVFCAFISFAQNIPGLFIPNMYGMKDYVGINSAGQAGYYVGAITVLLGLSIVVGMVGFFIGFAILAVIAIVVMFLFLGAVVTSPMRRK